MASITTTELKLLRLGKGIWIAVLVFTILICTLALLGYLLFEFPIEQRVASAVHMIPSAEFRYSGTTEQSGFMQVKKLIYWINSPYKEVRNYSFVTNYRESSNPYYVGHGTSTPDYSIRTYYLSELPQAELDKILMFPSDLCCYGDEPKNVSAVNFYIISSSWVRGQDSYTDMLFD